ncbi:coiled-coil domain-containing protein 112 [Cololabis saira]|uniref:coiled-coil domain-containing protein 112 n=1 Tax=Cololabis saira TaxID=129043 RepID=UPI002AD3756F|nr:coiled-coil domain-containing protein 112 [Cololabis saira]
MAARPRRRSPSHHKGQIRVQQAPPPSLTKEERRENLHLLTETLKMHSRRVQKLERGFDAMQALCKERGWTDVQEELGEYKKTVENDLPEEMAEQMKKEKAQVEALINSFREEQRLCMISLKREEDLCLEEIAAFEKKFESWSLPVKPIPKPPRAPNATTQERDHPAEVRALDAFLQKTGLYGGWEEYDHRDFLRFWTKYSGKTSYRAEVLSCIPYKTPKDILQHENWYQELLCLQEKKKEAIQRWKALKHQERQTRIQIEKKKEEKMQERKDEIDSDEEKEKLQKVKELQEWRKEKEEKEKKERKRKQQALREKTEKEKQHFLLVKLRLLEKEELQLRREIQEEEEKQMREAKEREIKKKRGREAEKAIKCLAEKDLQKIKKAIDEKQLREKEEEERQRRAAANLKKKMEGHVTRDPSRLVCPTKGWKERMKHIGTSGGGRVLQMCHRAIPTWRQGL